MFSKSRINEPGPAKAGESDKPKAPETSVQKPSTDYTTSSPKVKAAASVLSSDLTVVGNLRTTGDTLAPGQTVTVLLDVVEPAPDTVAFSFDFR